jgi:hypothetical protein
MAVFKAEIPPYRELLECYKPSAVVIVTPPNPLLTSREGYLPKLNNLIRLRSSQPTKNVIQAKQHQSGNNASQWLQIQPEYATQKVHLILYPGRQP